MRLVLNYDSRKSNYFPGHYNHEHLMDLFKSSGHSARSLALKAHKSKTVIGEAMVGECKKFETLWDINNALGGKWEDLFQLERKDRSPSRSCSNRKLGDGAVRRAAKVGVGRSIKGPTPNGR